MKSRNIVQALYARAAVFDPARTVVYVLRLVGAGVCFTPAAAASAILMLLWLAGFTDLGLGVYATMAAVIVGSFGLGFICLPKSVPARRRAVWDTVAGHPVDPDDDIGAANWDAEAIELERLFDRPAWQPPHEYRVRPACPPADLEPGRRDE